MPSRNSFVKLRIIFRKVRRPLELPFRSQREEFQPPLTKCVEICAFDGLHVVRFYPLGRSSGNVGINCRFRLNRAWIVVVVHSSYGVCDFVP
jgi:hypothetical protein